MQMAHRDEFPFTDLSLLMGIRERRFNWFGCSVHMHTLRGLWGRSEGISLDSEVTTVT